MKITPRVALEVAAHEGLVREAYRDHTGVWTWSVGITSASGHRVERYIGNPQPLERCLEVWIWLLERYADDVRAAFAGHSLTEAQFAAALSFHWNTGAIHQASWVQHWKNGDEAEAFRSIMRWNQPPGIIPRRMDERDLFFSGKWTGNSTILLYQRLKADRTVDFGSARRVDIRAQVEELLGDSAAVGAPVAATGSDEAESAGSYGLGDLLFAIVEIVKDLFGNRGAR